MSTSDGGGYCDCGDAEAWRFSPCCELHTPSNEEGRSADEVCHVKFSDKAYALMFKFVYQIPDSGEIKYQCGNINI